MLLQFKMPDERKAGIKSIIVLAGDIGATKTNLALYKIEGDRIITLQEQQYKSKDYNGFTQIAAGFLQQLPLPQSVCLGVAGPVLNNKARLSNLSWDMDGAEIASQVGVARVHLINDLEATAYGLAMLGEKDIISIHKGTGAPVGNAAVIAPGTGLGEAGLFWDGEYFHPFATEGGHSDFAPRDEFDIELYNYLQDKFGHVSWERLLCGPGIQNIYHFLRYEKKMEEPAWLTNKFINGDAAAVISGYVDQFKICKETMQVFIRYLAYESANLVLKLKATGGLFIGGGIAPKIVPLLANGAFNSCFCQSGRLNYLLERVPVKIILNPKTAMLGAAFYGTNN